MAWKQKHNIMYWYGGSSYASDATHQRSDEYNKRGEYGRVSRVSNARQHLKHGLQWVTKRYSRWYNGG